ncbi:hypothetical protein LINPERHAP2_LOCUS37376 [Linum perenne]
MKNLPTHIGIPFEALTLFNLSSINCHFMIFIRKVPSSLGLINNLRKFNVDLIDSLPPLVGSLYSLRVSFDISQILGLTIEQLLGCRPNLKIFLSVISCTILSGIRMRMFATLCHHFGNAISRLALICSLSSLNYKNNKKTTN